MTGLADRVPVPVVTVDRDGVVVRSNDAAVDYFGEYAAPGADLLAATAGEDEARLAAVVDDDVAEARIRFDDDAVGREAVVSGVPDEDGVSLVVDTVAEREEYRELVEGVVDPMYVLDADGTIVTVNDALVDAYGYSRSALVGEHATEFMPPDAYERGTESVRDLLAGDEEAETLEFRTERADGSERWAEVNLGVHTDDDGEFERTVGVIRDVTDRKRRERELADFETVAESAPVALFTVNEMGTITWANWRLYERLGMGQDDLVGRPFLDLVQEGFVEYEMVERYVDIVGDLLSADDDVERADHEEQLQLPDGETVTVEAHTTLLPLDEDGQFTGTVNAFRDVTQRQAYREELERQNERLETFATVVSHDLRNPLTVATGHLADARDRHPDDDALAEVETSLARMRELVDDVLELARQGNAERDPEPVDLERVARRAWGTVDTRDAALTVDVDGVVLALESQLRQLFENCFRNAVEHNPSASVAGDDDADALTVTVTGTDDGFAVEDDGVGLPSDVDVFEAGASTNEFGTGLGLVIVDEVANAHDWRVEAEDADDGGARFEVEGVEFADGP